jgi:hypothetical protein
MAQNTFRWGASQSVSVTSGTTPASSAVFGSQTRQIRVVTDRAVNLLITDGAVTSTAINTTGAMLPANVVDYLTVTPGQRLSPTISGTASTTTLTITEVGT